MQKHINSTCRKASSRLTLKSKLRYLLIGEDAKAIYQAMILPVMTYCCLVNHNSTGAQKKNLVSLDNRSRKIVNKNTHVIMIQDYNKRYACKISQKMPGWYIL